MAVKNKEQGKRLFFYAQTLTLPLGHSLAYRYKKNKERI